MTSRLTALHATLLALLAAAPAAVSATRRGLRIGPSMVVTLPTGEGRYRDGGGVYDLFKAHWYGNDRTGARREHRTKLPRAEDIFVGHR